MSVHQQCNKCSYALNLEKTPLDFSVRNTTRKCPNCTLGRKGKLLDHLCPCCNTWIKATHYYNHLMNTCPKTRKTATFQMKKKKLMFFETPTEKDLEVATLIAQGAPLDEYVQICHTTLVKKILVPEKKPIEIETVKTRNLKPSDDEENYSEKMVLDHIFSNHWKKVSTPSETFTLVSDDHEMTPFNVEQEKTQICEQSTIFIPVAIPIHQNDSLLRSYLFPHEFNTVCIE